MAGLTPQVGALGQHILELVDATETAQGPMVGPTVDISSKAHQELKLDQAWGDAATLETPLEDVLAYLELLFVAGSDHMRGLGRLLAHDDPSWFAHLAVVRAAVETSCRAWYIANFAIDAQERVRRHLCEQQYELAHREGLLGGALATLPAALHAAAKAALSDQRKRMIQWASATGLAVANGQIQGGRRGPADLLVDVYAADGQDFGAVAAYDYNQLSAVAHGLPSGVAIYHQAAPGAGLHAHNVLTPEHVGQAARAALFAYNAGFDQLALYFRWPHSDLQPIRWAAIHAMTALLPAP